MVIDIRINECFCFFLCCVLFLGIVRKTLYFEIFKEGSDLSVVERVEVWFFFKVFKVNRIRFKVIIRFL